MNPKSNGPIRNLLALVRQLRPRVVKTKEFLFTKHFLATNIAISTGFSGLGDLIEQYIERLFMSCSDRDTSRWDRMRTFKLALTGLPIGFISHYWYVYLDRRYTKHTHVNVFKKIASSQLIYAPICIVVFFLTLGVLNRMDWDEIKFNIVSKGKRLYIVDWLFWPPISLINFYLVPLHYRILYENMISLGFDVFNSYVYHNHPEKYIKQDDKERSG